jgi:UDP-N-acetyl-D-glucosamine dehydrogenase
MSMMNENHPVIRLCLPLERGAEVEYQDPFVPMIKLAREYLPWAGKKSVEWNRATVASFDLVLIATNHSLVNYRELANRADCIGDTRSAMASISPSKAKIWEP